MIKKNINSESKKIFSTQDALQVAKQRLPRLIFDFIEGSTGREVAALRNLTRFDEITLQPRVMQDVEIRNLKTPFFGPKLRPSFWHSAHGHVQSCLAWG